jgi:uncharacterized membrane protein YfcA
MEAIGYFSSLLIGISLGLIGGGGSILTVPVLVYLFSIDAVMATGYSLFIVGTTSLVGAWSKYKQGLVNMKVALTFGAPSILAVYLTRLLLVPAIPNPLMHIGDTEISRRLFLMGIFALLMILASVSMIRSRSSQQEKNNSPAPARSALNKYLLIMGEGILVGTLTGLVGAGGGFLIIPALVLLTGLSMKEAVGTSLLIIAAKSLAGFLGDVANIEINWTFLSIITLLAIVGIVAGNKLSQKINGEKLKQSFGWFVLVMGSYILIKEIWFV